MTKKVDTDPNFPPASEPEPSSARPPPSRAKHNTFPDSPVIVSQTNPGVAPPSNPNTGGLAITAEERARLDELAAAHERANGADKLREGDRDADTSPPRRRLDPPGVASDPGLKQPAMRSLSKVAIACALIALFVVIVVVATHAQQANRKTQASSPTKRVTTLLDTANVPPPEATDVVSPIATNAIPVISVTALATSPKRTPQMHAPDPTAPIPMSPPTETVPPNPEPTSTSVDAPPGFKPKN